MFCSNCGAKVPDDNANFCFECGAPLYKGEEREPEQNEEPGSTPSSSTVPPTDQNQSEAVRPEPQQGGTAAVKPTPNKNVIAIIAIAVIAVVALVAVFALTGKPASGPQPGSSASSAASAGSASSSASSESTASSASSESASSESSAASAASAASASQSSSSPDDGLTPKERREFFEGKWVATNSSDEKRPEGWFKSMAAEGLYYTLILWDDGTGVFRTPEGPTKITWEASTMTSATTTIDGEDMTITLRSKELTLTNSKGVDVYFVPEDEVDMSNAVDLSQHGFGVTVDPNTIEVGEYLKLIGNESVGYMQVPESWVNRINDLDDKEVKSYDIVYYVDSKSEYVSPEKGGYAFSLRVEMSRHSASYKEVAQGVYDTFTADENYGPASMERMTVGKRRAIVVKSTNLVDNVNVAWVIIDRDNDEKVSVVLAYNCGAIGNDKAVDWVMAYTESWQVE